ncbi:hypothetical protein EMPS_02321 [Entomortierella parvispora]|uniref:Aspergillus nuclease S(1) n=1 Tax=Entomortierella parvispora TaxID=205924 RepID=A0A9P3H4M9_9FUNG|nr:hypothetical protein EMPS_02321 [Entomortierella parvispora]
MRLSSVSFAVASLVAFGTSHVHAWGAVGHTITGQIAQQFLTAQTASQVEQILSPTYQGLLGDAAPWADTVRYISGYKWATPQHFINPKGDDPPNHCVMEYVYSGQDNVNAIFNMTATLVQFQANPPTSSEDIQTRGDALKFLIHFVGDVHQPLHDSTRERGGNEAPIKWGKTKNNLHHMWDTLILTKDIEDRFNNDPSAYVADTLSLIHNSSVWSSEMPTWTACDSSLNNVQTPWSTTIDTLKTVCPIEWATTQNQQDCTYIWQNYSPTKDYSTTYFQSVTGPANGYLLQKWLAAAGVRMATLLNEIFDPTAAPPLSKRGISRLPKEV